MDAAGADDAFAAKLPRTPEAVRVIARKAGVGGVRAEVERMAESLRDPVRTVGRSCLPHYNTGLPLAVIAGRLRHGGTRVGHGDVFDGGATRRGLRV
jgi:hypothetical protein